MSTGDKIDNKAEELRGKAKEGIGKATGNDRMAAEGAAERVEGKIQKGVGNVKDAARDALKH